jgi:hypothetical protein
MPLFDEARGQISPLGFDYNGRRLIVAATNEYKRRAVYYYDLEAGRLGDLIAGHPQFDIIPERGTAALDGVALAGPVVSDLAEERGRHPLHLRRAPQPVVRPRV